MFRRRNEQPVQIDAQTPFAYRAPEPQNLELREIEKCFARLFSTDDGRRALAYLQTVTFQRALGPASTDQQLRYAEGQRAMVATILRLIDRGRNPS